jgi:hypothetical protein
LLLPAAAQAVAAGDFDITPATGWTYASNRLEITTPGSYTISMATPGTTTTADNITVNGGPASNFNITLNGVSSVQSVSAAFYIFSGNSLTVNLTLVGANTLKSRNYESGLRVPPDATLRIDGAGSLTAIGGTASPGIGGSATDTASGSITITGNVSVTATGGAGASEGGGAGIGSGGSSTATPRAAGSISIDTTGTVTATGGSGGAGGAGANIGQGGYIGGDGAGLNSLTHPADASGAAGGSATFTCAAALAAGGGTLGWNWQSDSSGAWTTIVPVVTTPTLPLSPLTAAMSGTHYRCEAFVTGVGAPAASNYISYMSRPATLTVTGATLTATAVPALHPWALALLALAVLGVAGLSRQHRT